MNCSPTRNDKGICARYVLWSASQSVTTRAAGGRLMLMFTLELEPKHNWTNFSGLHVRTLLCNTKDSKVSHWNSIKLELSLHTPLCPHTLKQKEPYAMPTAPHSKLRSCHLRLRIEGQNAHLFSPCPQPANLAASFEYRQIRWARSGEQSWIASPQEERQCLKPRALTPRCRHSSSRRPAPRRPRRERQTDTDGDTARDGDREREGVNPSTFGGNCCTLPLPFPWFEIGPEMLVDTSCDTAERWWPQNLATEHVACLHVISTTTCRSSEQTSSWGLTPIQNCLQVFS